MADPLMMTGDCGDYGDYGDYDDGECLHTCNEYIQVVYEMYMYVYVCVCFCESYAHAEQRALTGTHNRGIEVEGGRDGREDSHRIRVHDG